MFKVQLDGVDLQDFNVQWLRKQLGIVGQEPVLFATTIYENIKYGLDFATQENVEEAAKLADAHDFIIKLPNVSLSLFFFTFAMTTFFYLSFFW